MTGKERMLAALNREVPDRLPCSIHQWQPYHLQAYMNGMDELEAFRAVGLDAAIPFCEGMEQMWVPRDPDTPDLSPDWQIHPQVLSRDPDDTVVRYTVTTPEGDLSYATGTNRYTTWITECLIKEPERDVELIEKYMPVPQLDQERIAQVYDGIGDAGILRGFVWGEQAGCWQHACCLYGEEPMIYAAIDTPHWVHHLLEVLLAKKLQFIEESLDGSRFDLVETGGGAGSSTVISPAMHEAFCLPYARRMHEACHAVGQKVVYHTCGGMMPLLDLIAANGCDASETLSPPEVGGDVRDIGEVNRRIGDRVALVGGMNQFQVLTQGTPEDIRAEVHRLFEAAGPGGGYICSACDHFFDAPPENLKAFADAGRECLY
ncbi:MAG: uroporphyrinogen decarboxylase family protein [Phycisphaerae bacterium]